MTEEKTTRQERIDQYVKMSRKSVVVAIVLAVLFGPIGYLYASVVGGVILILLAVILAMSTPSLVVIAWVLSVLFAPFGVTAYNRRKRAEAELMAGGEDVASS